MKKRINFLIEENQHNELMLLAKYSGQNVTDILRRLITDFLKKNSATLDALKEKDHELNF